ncbi:acetyl-CoA carboxylase biotin carboxyl carrier protein subunit [Sneathiella glossodoripedis]|uniref:acetyl-CoA carboxylase biotin carboxyl carrier protein subunit n=1 Tax=Sneathiella glossodoripedis TaxID=418853 RepID=UPI000470AC7E|nr:acetyl-CoA carboxylase biotin carboxyl carrier protein subunit [Sneathiella glossodoripedis]
MAVIDIESEIAGKVWKIETEIGQKLEEDDSILILESMKMEIPVDAPEDGTLIEILVKEGDPVNEGQVVARLEV